MRLNRVFPLIPLILLAFSVLPGAKAGIVVTYFGASSYNANTAAMDTALGISGATIEDFEDFTLIPGLSIVLSGGVSATLNSLPVLFDGSVCPGVTSGQAWDGTDSVDNASGNSLNSCSSPNNIANLITLNYTPGTTLFGLGLSNLQSLNPPAPLFPVTNHNLLINGVSLGTIESLAGANFNPGIIRNGYIRIDATGGDLITSVGIQNVNQESAQDFLMIDHVAVAAADTPEPSTAVLMLTALLPLGWIVRRRLVR